MWVRIKIGFLVTVAVILLAFFHYSLPQRDIVQVSGTEIIRMNIDESSWFFSGSDAGTAGSPTRDVRLINTSENGRIRVYRNEDTGWSWPPYLKFDSSDLQAQAQEFAKDDTAWVAVRHYGWRIRLFSMYPNATSMRQVEGPDVSLIPWFNIIFLTVLAATAWGVFVRVRRWKDANIDPVIENIGETLEDVGESVGETRGRFGRWLDSWKPKDRR